MMKENQKKHYHSSNDPFWTEHARFFTASFPSYYTKQQKVWGRFHTSKESYADGSLDLLPLKHQKGTRTYVLMQPYVREPVLTLRVGLYQ